MKSSPIGSRIAEGRTAEVYTWQENKVIKLFYAWVPPALVGNEIEIGRMISKMTLPTPRLLDTVEIEGRKGIIFERVNGDSMLKTLIKKPWCFARYARELAELHTEIHRQKGMGLKSLRPILTVTIQQVESLSTTLRTSVLQLLEQLPDGEALCHCDFHPDQVMITSKGPVILDWLTACQGNPLADVARTVLILSIGDAPYADWAMRLVVNTIRRFFLRSYIARYLKLNPGIRLADIKTWMVPVAAARLHEGIKEEQEKLMEMIRSKFPDK